MMMSPYKKTRAYLYPLLFLLLFAACQVTPKQDIIVNKNEGVLENALAVCACG